MQAAGSKAIRKGPEPADRAEVSVVLRDRLQAAIARLNTSLPQDARDEALRKVLIPSVVFTIPPLSYEWLKYNAYALERLVEA